MAQINFTEEHRKRLMDLAGEALITGTTIGGSVGTQMNIYDLFHNTAINTLTRIHGTIKKEIAEIEALDEWSLTEHQQRKASRLKKILELVFLLIGFKRKEEENKNTKATAKELDAQIATLKRSTMTPEDQIKELEAKRLALGPVTVE